jgi:hypothetical protein
VVFSDTQPGTCRFIITQQGNDLLVNRDSCTNYSGGLMEGTITPATGAFELFGSNLQMTGTSNGSTMSGNYAANTPFGGTFTGQKT